MSTYVLQILAGIASGAILFLVASGLTLVFGALRIVNFAHGSLYMLGAFFMVSIGETIGFSNGTFWVSMILTALAVAGLGGVIEMLVLRPVYSRPNLTQLIVTFGLVLIAGGFVRAVYGSIPIRTEIPPVLRGSVSILDRGFPVYQLFLIGLAALVAATLWALLYRTGLGRMIRAAVSDPDLLALSGVNVRWLFTGVFVIGTFFAGLAGAAVPSQGAAVLGMDIEVIVKAFVVIVIGGMGSLGGALVGALLVGIAESLGILWIPDASLVVVFAVLVLVLAVRPQGLFGRPEMLAPARAVAAALPRFSLDRLFRVPGRASARGIDTGVWILAAIGIVAAGLLPFFTSVNNVLVGTSALVFALFALSLNLLLGTAGLVSFGHALFFGFGAYTIALAVTKQGWPPLAVLAVTPALGAVAGLVTGLIALRATELYFALLTLGIAQLTYAGSLGWYSFTGGSNGLLGSFAPSWLVDPSRMYWFVFGCVLFCALLLFIVTRSPFGDALRGIRENRRRAEFIGLWLKRYELTAYVIAGAFASIAGGLFAVFQLQANVNLFHWTTSALPVIMSLLGGLGSFLGPALGSFFYTFLNNVIANRTVFWDLIIGGIVLFAALAMPSGLVGVLRSLAAGGLLLLELLGRAIKKPIPVPALARAAAEGVHIRRLREGVETVTAAGGSARDLTEAPILVVEGLSKRFGGLAAVEDVSLSVRRGSMHAIIGPNGAGKTTLFNLITGLLPCDTGKIVFEGNDVTGAAPWRLVKRGMGRSFQQTNLFWALSTLKNVALAEAAVRDTTHRFYGAMPEETKKRAGAILERVGLASLSGVPATELSHGDQRSLELAAAIGVESELLLLDEPTAGLSPSETKAAVEMIRELAREHDLTVLFIEHDMEVVFGVADTVTVLHEGSVLAEGTPEEIRRNEAVKKAYLGEDLVEAEAV